jgi:ferrous iron transport protein B
MWFKGEQYLRKMGGVILVASIIIWALVYFPRNENMWKQFEKQKAETEVIYNQKIAKSEGSERSKLDIDKSISLAKLDATYQSQHIEQSYIGKLGKTIEPVIQPLGFDWKMGVSLLTGIAAKEVVVSTFGVLYQARNADSGQSLQNKLKEARYTSGPKSGQHAFTPLVAFCFILFILIYFPCIAVMAAITRETGHWKWTVFVLVYTTGLAWLIAFITYRLGSLLGHLF